MTLITEETQSEYVHKLVQLMLNGERLSYRDITRKIHCGSPRDVMLKAREYFNTHKEVYGGNITHTVMEAESGKKFYQFFFLKGFEWEKQVQVTGKVTEKQYIESLELQKAELKTQNTRLTAAVDYYKRREKQDKKAHKGFAIGVIGVLLGAVSIAGYALYLATQIQL